MTCPKRLSQVSPSLYLFVASFELYNLEEPDERNPPVSLREQRTQEELKAIEALEELSRQKSVDVLTHRGDSVDVTPSPVLFEEQPSEQVVEQATSMEDQESFLHQTDRNESLEGEQDKMKDSSKIFAARSLLNGIFYSHSYTSIF